MGRKRTVGGAFQLSCVGVAHHGFSCGKGSDCLPGLPKKLPEETALLDGLLRIAERDGKGLSLEPWKPYSRSGTRPRIAKSVLQGVSGATEAKQISTEAA